MILKDLLKDTAGDIRIRKEEGEDLLFEGSNRVYFEKNVIDDLLTKQVVKIAAETEPCRFGVRTYIVYFIDEN